MNGKIKIGSVVSSDSSNRWFSAVWTAIGGALLAMAPLLVYTLIATGGNPQSRTAPVYLLGVPLGFISLALVGSFITAGFIFGYLVDVARVLQGLRYITADNKEYLVQLGSDEIRNILSSSTNQDEAETKTRKLLVESNA